MKTDEVEVASPSCEGERASERTPGRGGRHLRRSGRQLDAEGRSATGAQFYEKMRVAEIARLEKSLRDLIEGFRHLRTVRPVPHDLQERLRGQAARLQAVERKLFHLRQRRLL